MNLRTLKIDSFITSMDYSSIKTVKGGVFTVHGSNCDHTLNTPGCGATNVQSCTGGGAGSGWNPSDGCSNNSCGECHAF